MMQLDTIPRQNPTPFAVAGRRVRLLDPGDAPALGRLFDRCGEFYRRPDPARVTLGIDAGADELAGVILARPTEGRTDSWELELLLLAPEWRGRGIGSTAYWAFQHWVADQGAGALLLTVPEGSPRARRFWQSLGFTRSLRTPAVYEKALM